MTLKEYKASYKSVAELLPNYKSLSQIELAEGALAGGPLADSYLSALVIRYWNIVSRTAYADSGLYDETLAYDWYIGSIMYALKHQVWNNPESTLYKDPKAIEKILNVHVRTERINFFYASNRYKRKINHDSISIENMLEVYGDCALPEAEDAEVSYPLHKEMVWKYCAQRKFLHALILDLIIYDLELTKQYDINELVNQLLRLIKSLPDNYLDIFTEQYNLDAVKVHNVLDKILNTHQIKLKESIYLCLVEIKAILKREFR